MLEMVVQEYPPWAENVTVIGSDPVEAVVEVRARAGDMPPPPQALHTIKPASARMTPPTEILKDSLRNGRGCKTAAIAKPKHSRQLAPISGTHFATVEDVCHYISAGIGRLYLQVSLKSLTTGRPSCLTPETLAREA